VLEPAVKINEKELKRFRKRAIAAYRRGKEYIEVMAGYITEKLITVVKFFTISHKATIDSIVDLGWLEVEEAAKEAGLEIVGTIHSHPDNYTWPSEEDKEGCRILKEKVYAILGINKSSTKGSSRVSTKLAFWWPQYSVKKVILSRTMKM
jgi:proteasome lid subunit RPN8/RPN11